MVSNYLHAIDHCKLCTTKDKHPTCIQGFCRTHSALPMYDTFLEHQRSCQCSPPSLRKIPVGAPLAKITEQRASIWSPSTSHHSRLDTLHDYCHRLAHRRLSYSRTVKHPPSEALLPSRCSHKLNRRTGFCLWACQCWETLSRLLPVERFNKHASWIPCCRVSKSKGNGSDDDIQMQTHLDIRKIHQNRGHSIIQLASIVEKVVIVCTIFLARLVAQYLNRLAVRFGNLTPACYASFYIFYHRVHTCNIVKNQASNTYVVSKK